MEVRRLGWEVVDKPPGLVSNFLPPTLTLKNNSVWPHAWDSFMTCAQPGLMAGRHRTRQGNPMARNCLVGRQRGQGSGNRLLLALSF